MQPIKFSDLVKIQMNRRRLLKKHFRICGKKNPNNCSEIAKIANFHFPHYKSMEIISCHSNQTAGAIAMKNSNSIEVSTKIISVKFELYWPQSFCGDDFLIFFYF